MKKILPLKGLQRVLEDGLTTVLQSSSEILIKRGDSSLRSITKTILKHLEGRKKVKIGSKVCWTSLGCVMGVSLCLGSPLFITVKFAISENLAVWEAYRGMLGVYRGMYKFFLKYTAVWYLCITVCIALKSFCLANLSYITGYATYTAV